jgi:hypothetical protein
MQTFSFSPPPHFLASSRSARIPHDSRAPSARPSTTLEKSARPRPISNGFQAISTDSEIDQILTSDFLQGQNKPWDSKYKMYPWDSKATIDYRAETYAWDSKYPKRNRGIVNSAAVPKLIDRGRERRRRNWPWRFLGDHRHDAGIHGGMPSYLL